MNVHEAKTHLSKLLEQAHVGQEIILAKAGEPYARPMPVATEPPKLQLGRLIGQVGAEFFEPLPASELDAWEGG